MRSGDTCFWDPLTAAISVNESLGSFEPYPVLVMEVEGPESMATRVDEGGSLVRITTAAAGECFKQRFSDVLNGGVTE